MSDGLTEKEMEFILEQGEGQMIEFKEAGLPDIEFEYFEHSFHVSLQGQEVTERVTERVTENQRKIMELMAANRYITIRAIAGEIGMSERKVKENISKLKEKGLIKRIGPDRGGYWEVVEWKG